MQVELDTFLLQLLAQTLGDVAVKCRQTLLEELDYGNFTAETIEHTGELHADDTCSYDAEALGQLGQIEQLGAVKNHIRVHVGYPWHLRT